MIEKSIMGIIIDPKDNVASVTEEAPAGAPVLCGERVVVSRGVPKYHKLALRDICAGERVVKYGETIGAATEDIPAGAHVHNHNIKSLLEDKT